jgi:chemotaxis protein MotB
MAKKKEAHHGGAWKVAFADFMTAMMALFLVLWISAQDEKILIATSQYFQNPFNSPMDNTSGVMPFNSNKSTTSIGKDSGDAKEMDRNKQIEMTFLTSVAADFYRLLHLDQNLEDKPIDIQVTSDGLRVTLFDRAKRPIFVPDTTEFTEWGRYVMQSLAWMIERHHFRVSIDGHTSQHSHGKSPDYSAWELSADRANAARRSLVHYAIDEKTIERVTGYAATRPLPGEKPEAEANERVTLSLTLTSKVPKDDPAGKTAKAEAQTHGLLSRMGGIKSAP